MSTSTNGFLGRFTDDSEDFVLALLEYMIWPILLVVVACAAYTRSEHVSEHRLGAVDTVAGGTDRSPRSFVESICLLSGHFDLSVGAIMGFSAMFTGMLLGNCPAAWGVIGSPASGFVIILVVGGLIGVFNGAMISKLQPVPADALDAHHSGGRDPGAQHPTGSGPTGGPASGFDSPTSPS